MSQRGSRDEKSWSTRSRDVSRGGRHAQFFTPPGGVNLALRLGAWVSSPTSRGDDK